MLGKFPKVQKGFSRLSKVDRLRSRTLAVIRGALVAASLVVVSAEQSTAHAATGGSTPTIEPTIAGIFVLAPAISISINDGSTVVAGHYSHSSHVSHASHASHCSGYSYC